jgi:hypothetical protein
MSMIGELRHVPATLFAPLGDKATRKRVADDVMEADGLSLNKLWNAMSYVLERVCGEDPIRSVGDPLDFVDTGYGPPMLMTVEDVQAAAVALADVDEGDLREAFDPDDMKAEQVYCQPGDDEAERAAYLDELLGLFRELRAFVEEAADRGHGVLWYLT